MPVEKNNLSTNVIARDYGYQTQICECALWNVLVKHSYPDWLLYNLCYTVLLVWCILYNIRVKHNVLRGPKNIDFLNVIDRSDWCSYFFHNRDCSSVQNIYCIQFGGKYCSLEFTLIVILDLYSYLHIYVHIFISSPASCNRNSYS